MSNVEDEQERLELNRWIRLQCRNFPTPKAFNIWHKTYIYGARYNFDDYLIFTLNKLSNEYTFDRFYPGTQFGETVYFEDKVTISSVDYFWRIK